MKRMDLREEETIETTMVRLPRCTLPGYETVDFWEAIDMWKEWTLFGFPNNGGTMDQGALWLEVIKVLQYCAQRMKVV